MNDELQPSGAKQKSGETPPIALIGWTHRELPNGIDLRIECARSRIALENDQIEHRDIVMTRNQALLLARYLLKVTGQSLPIEAKPGLWTKMKSALGGSNADDRRASRKLAS